MLIRWWRCFWASCSCFPLSFSPSLLDYRLILFEDDAVFFPSSWCPWPKSRTRLLNCTLISRHAVFQLNDDQLPSGLISRSSLSVQKKIKSRELLWKTISMYMNTKQRRGRRRGRKHKERKCRHEGDERETEEDGGEQNREEEHSLNIFHGHTVNHYFGFDYQVGRARLILADNNSFLKSNWIKRWADNPFFKADRIKTAGGWFKSCRWLTVSRDGEDDTQEGNVLLCVSKSRLHWGMCVCLGYI